MEKDYFNYTQFEYLVYNRLLYIAFKIRVFLIFTDISIPCDNLKKYLHPFLPLCETMPKQFKHARERSK